MSHQSWIGQLNVIVTGKHRLQAKIKHKAKLPRRKASLVAFYPLEVGNTVEPDLIAIEMLKSVSFKIIKK